MKNKIKNSKLVVLACAISSILTTSCNQQDATPSVSVDDKTAIVEAVELTKQQELQQSFEQATKTLFKHRAVSATLFGVSDETAGYHYKSAMENYSSASENKLRADLSALSEKLKAIKSDSKNDEENRIVVADIIDYFSGAKDMPVGYIDPWMGHSAFVVNQINGPLIDAPNNLINSHTVKTETDANDFIARLNAFGPMLNSINQKVLDDAKSNWIPPKVILQKSINYLEGFVANKLDSNTMLTSFSSKVEQLDSLTPEARVSMKEQAKQALVTHVYPGYQTILDTLKGLQPKATSESGIWAQPGGKEFYQYSVSKLGDTDLSPEEIHDIGLKEVERITAEMESILVAEGYTEGSVGARVNALSDEPRFVFEDSDQGRADLLQSLRDSIKEIEVLMPTQFKSVPPYPVEVKRIPVATQDSSAGGYYTPPAIDGSVPGIYWINLKEMKANPKFGLKTLTYHEAVPGHHWQVALNMAQEQMPLLRRIAPYNAYVEGWALYSEQVAYEMGLYKDDPFGNLGRLKAELFRSVRLVVDTGMHAKKWSREQAIEYMASTTGTAQSDVVSEIERYMAWPGQALGYKLGMLKILSLREYAKSKLRTAYDSKQFHDLILLSGAVPMKVLDEKVKAWVETYL
jgi:uncharacterized protein (DUF885 family)